MWTKKKQNTCAEWYISLWVCAYHVTYQSIVKSDCLRWVFGITIQIITILSKHVIILKLLLLNTLTCSREFYQTEGSTSLYFVRIININGTLLSIPCKQRATSTWSSRTYVTSQYFNYNISRMLKHSNKSLIHPIWWTKFHCGPRSTLKKSTEMEISQIKFIFLSMLINSMNGSFFILVDHSTYYKNRLV